MLRPKETFYFYLYVRNDLFSCCFDCNCRCFLSRNQVAKNPVIRLGRDVAPLLFLHIQPSLFQIFADYMLVKFNYLKAFIFVNVINGVHLLCYFHLYPY